IVDGCLVWLWHRWQRNGSFATSMRSLFEPCGSWQVAQLSPLMPACSNRNGPRFSAWHDAHASLTELPVRSSLTFVDPCGLWHEVHSILPSRTGMWPERSSFATLSRWQFMHSCCWSFAFSCAVSDIG